RGTPKVQSALLEALEERQVSIDGATYPLPERFCLIATQNPRGQFGTFPLPESQLDRFLFKTTMGKLSREEELKLLSEVNRSEEMLRLQQIVTSEEISQWVKGIKSVKASQNILEYILDIVEKTRSIPEVSGLSPRATRDLVDAVKAYAFLNGRDFAIPDDVQEIFPFVAGHRLYNSQTYSIEQEHLNALAILKTVEVKVK
ncbi:MAG: MoxR family ATPase, partial [Bacteriovoracaceae bacterium]